MMISQTVQTESRHSSTAQPVTSGFTNRRIMRTNQKLRLIPVARDLSSRSLLKIESFYWPLLRWLRIRPKAMDFRCDMFVRLSFIKVFLNCIMSSLIGALIKCLPKMFISLRMPKDFLTEGKVVPYYLPAPFIL